MRRETIPPHRSVAADGGRTAERRGDRSPRRIETWGRTLGPHPDRQGADEDRCHARGARSSAARPPHSRQKVPISQGPRITSGRPDAELAPSNGRPSRSTLRTTRNDPRSVALTASPISLARAGGMAGQCDRPRPADRFRARRCDGPGHRSGARVVHLPGRDGGARVRRSRDSVRARFRTGAAGGGPYCQ